MNIQQYDILKLLAAEPFINQRALAEKSGHSLGIVNHSIKELKQQKYLDENMLLTFKAKQEIAQKSPHNAIILAAGFGMRMIPINMETPKGLLEVKGERLIERIIRQLHEVNIREIYVVTGFMKEKYEYLIDQFQVELVVNSEYAVKNNLHSLKKVVKHLENTYIIPCDIWCRQNPFSSCELYSWYMVSDLISPESNIRINRKAELVSTASAADGNAMIGIAYLLCHHSDIVKKQIEQLCQDVHYNNAFWEETLYHNRKMIVAAKLVSSQNVIEINTYEQLRDLDSDSNHLKSDVIMIISQILKVRPDDITGITTLKKGMTNRSFLFTCAGKKYIMRIPGEGTDRLINRTQEAMIYQIIRDKGIADNTVYINPENGYKITEFIEGARVCNPEDKKDVITCMEKLRLFHEMKFVADHEFDLFEQIELYESLWQAEPSIYKDYSETKKKVLSLRKYIESHIEQKTLTHIDAVPDNFLFSTDAQGNEHLYLIDWEYAGMQDPHVDIAMFCIYSLYDRQQIDELIQIYFTEGCSSEIKVKIYCYIAVCGLLWSNWCEYKRLLGIDFGEYSLRQYRYAKDYYRIVCEVLGKEKELWDIK